MDWFRLSPALLLVLALGGCARGVSGAEGDGIEVDGGRWPDARGAKTADAGQITDVDAGHITDVDAGTQADAGVVTTAADAAVGTISGGPCVSGANGATAYRIRWNGSGGTAYVSYLGNGLPDTSRDHAAAYGYQIGFTPSYVDTFLDVGGLQLNSSSFVDIELSTMGISSISSATLSVFGRSYNTTTSGSFTWQSFSGTGSAPTNLVANSAPYQWYSAELGGALVPGDDGVLLRIKAGPSSGSLVVREIELCMQAQ